MKKYALKIFSALFVLMLIMPTVSAKSVEKERAEIDELSQKVLTRLYAKYPSAKRVIKNCYGYSTLGATGTQLGFTGDSHGRGIAFKKLNGEK